MVACGQITTVKEFVEKLKSFDRRDYPSLFKALDVSHIDFQQNAIWLKDSYARVCLERNKDFELIMLCWSPFSTTPIHDHDSQSCWVYQVEGKIEEKRYEICNNDVPKVINENTLHPKQLTYMDDKMGFHSLSNPTEHRAITLHLYVNPIDKCTVYNADDNALKVKSLSYCKDLHVPNSN